MQSRHAISTVEDYEPFIGQQAVERILAKGRKLSGRSIAHVNSTYFGGGVAEILSSLTLLMRALGLDAEWRAIQGPPDFFSITKKMHNALQGEPIRLTDIKKEIYEDIAFQNAIRNRFDHDYVVVHDPQPLPLVEFSRKRGPWIWRCHVDMAHPSRDIWEYLAGYIEQYDAMIVSAEEYRQPWRLPQRVFQPAIDPFSIINRELPEGEVDRRLRHYGVPLDLPLVVQVSRFDRWKDPHGVIRAFQIARRVKDCTLVLVGNVATDDPEGPAVYESLLREKEERVLILSGEDTSFVNALQRRAAVVLQKSLREGFGLTVAEAMWKRTPVIGGNVGGIRYQIEDGVNGFLVSSVEETADRLVRLLSDEQLRRRMGEAARETVRQRFLMTRYLEQYLDLMDGFETHYRLRPETPALSTREEAAGSESPATH
ncbi:glycosyltransferase [Corallococcus llansteffanensis]|uniref:Glycosyltransferase n=1 Tax=Corallococcus llansteffanensis TaxID=2316731 RepID=A0A3A8PV34_9BACT|nr:glycosyltransferase [Corallococcus llansteffanensis]RKH60253.1 glycosyltransferase [Corallococcus llansteffanensis]